MDLEPRQLEAFVATVRTGSFTRAARELGTGQPAVSQAVRRLEDALGVVLLERRGRTVVPTPAGTAFVPDASAVLEALGAARATARRLAGGEAGVVRVVSTPGSLALLRPLLEAFASAEPHARVELVPRPARGRREALRRSDIDVALVRSARPARGIAYTLAVREPWRVVLAAGHPLSAEPRPELEPLARWPFVSLTSHGASEPSPALVAYRAAAESAHLTPEVGPEVTALDDLLAQLYAGRAWTLLTQANTSTLTDGLLALPAPPTVEDATLWLAHRARPTTLVASLAALAARGAPDRG